jgi:hypothetical protein
LKFQHIISKSLAGFSGCHPARHRCRHGSAKPTSMSTPAAGAGMSLALASNEKKPARKQLMSDFK